MALLTEEEIETMLAGIPTWNREGDSIVRESTFEDFPAAIKAVNAVATLAEEQNHHPDILIQYNRVNWTLSTHSAGGLTEKDFRLAAGIETILS